MPTPLADLIESDEFVRRHIGPERADVDHMLQTIGAASIDALLDETMPDTIRACEPLGLPAAAAYGLLTDLVSILRESK